MPHNNIIIVGIYCGRRNDTSLYSDNMYNALGAMGLLGLWVYGTIGII
jgi:hypothetical protein